MSKETYNEKIEIEKPQDKFLEKVLDQIRCKKARPHIAKELEAHLEDQIADNIKAGMSKEKAEQEAVRDMGDPVETGIALDHIHKPQIAWKLIILVVLISIAGIIVHTVIAKNSGVGVIRASKNYAIHVAIGIAVMCGIYFLDYTWIAKHAKKIGVVLLAMCALGSVFSIYSVNGNIYWPLYDWFKVSKSKTIAGIWGISIIMPSVIFAVMYFGDYLSAYHKARITAWNDCGNEMNYLSNLVQSMMKKDQMIGANGVNISQRLPDYNADYILTYLSATYGVIVVM